MKPYSRSDFLDLLTGNSKGNSIGSDNVSKNGFKPTGTGNAGYIGNSGINPYTGEWGQEQILHLIRRTLFGATKEDYDYFSKLTLGQCLDTLLKQSPNSSPPLNAYNDDIYMDPDVPFGEPWVNCEFSDGKGIADHKRLASLRAWWVGLMINQDRSLTEKMILFWHSHVTGEFYGMQDARSGYTYVAPLQLHALGNFKQLILEISISTGMLQYLSGNHNCVTAPNENYARELQELFTIGKDAGLNYTQDDIVAAARILTGWATPHDPDFPSSSAEALQKKTLATPPHNGTHAIFYPLLHDTGDKQFSAFYNNTIIKGKSGQVGASELNELIEMIFGKKEVARHTCRKLYRWFVNSEINSFIEVNIIAPLADIFLKNNYEIIPVLRALLGSEHFFDSTVMRIHIKNPVDHLVGLCRQFKITGYPDNLSNQYKAWYKIALALESSGMSPGYPPNVAGWPAYYLSPSYYQLWINSDSIVARHMITDNLFSANGYGNLNNEVCIQFNVIAFTNQLSDPGNLDQLIIDTNALLSPIPFDSVQIAHLKSIMLKEQDILALSGQASDDSWHNAWNTYSSNPGNEAAKLAVQQRLSLYYTYLLRQAECQLM